MPQCPSTCVTPQATSSGTNNAPIVISGPGGGGLFDYLGKQGTGRTLTIQAPNEFSAFGIVNKFELDGMPPTETWTGGTTSFVAATGLLHSSASGGISVTNGNQVKIDFTFQNQIYVSGIQCGYHCTFDVLSCKGATTSQ